MEAYEDMIQNTATKDAPWYVVPADNKWFTRVVVAAAVIDALASLDLHYPKVSKEKLKELAAAKRALQRGQMIHHRAHPIGRHSARRAKYSPMEWRCFPQHNHAWCRSSLLNSDRA